MNQLTRTFAVYAGNAATLFDKAFEDFMDKFRQSLQKAGMTIRTIDFTADDSALLENRAMSYISQGEFLQAFTYERLAHFANDDKAGGEPAPGTFLAARRSYPARSE